MALGYITSDCDADGYVFSTHHYTATAEEAVADVLHAGTDVDCGSQYLLRQIFLLILPPFRSRDICPGAGTPNTSRKRSRLAT